MERADILTLKQVFEKYASERGEDGQSYLSYEDMVVRYLGLLPEREYNPDTLTLLAGVVDQTKDGRISFSEFVTFEANLCNPDALYRTAFQLFDRDGKGHVSFAEFENIMKRSSSKQFDMDSDFVQLFFGKNRDRSISFTEFSQFLHDCHNRYSKYVFKALDPEGSGYISVDDFCDMIFSIKSHLVTPDVKKVIRSFVRETQGEKVTYGYSTAFQSILGKIEIAKQVYLQASQGSKSLEVSKSSFLHSSQTMSRLSPLEVDILFSLSNYLHDNPLLSLRYLLHDNLIYSDLQTIAPEQYMQQVTKTLVNIKLVEKPEDRNIYIELMEFVYRLSIGSVAGMLGAAVVYPTDLARTRIVNQRNTIVYQDGVDCMKKVLRHEGLSGLYRGLGVQLLCFATGRATKLATNDFVRDRLSTSTNQVSLLGEVFAGATAGLVNGVISSPLELVKIRLQCAGQYDFYTIQTGSATLRELGGLRNIFKGCGATILREIPFGSIYFPSYNHIKMYLSDYSGYNGPLSIFLAGTLAGIAAEFVTQPIDLVKTRIQVIPRPGQIKYDGIVDAVEKIYRKEGYSAFWKGWKGSVARKVRCAQYGLTFLTYELVQRLFYVDFGGTRPSGSQRETTSGSVGLYKSRLEDHVGGYMVAKPIFDGIESKFGLRFPKFRDKQDV